MKLIKDEPRWNSTFFIQWLYEQREAIGAALTSLNTRVSQLEASSQRLRVLCAFNPNTVDVRKKSSSFTAATEPPLLSPQWWFNIVCLSTTNDPVEDWVTDWPIHPPLCHQAEKHPSIPVTDNSPKQEKF